jgi:uncharacterized protein YcnI
MRFRGWSSLASLACSAAAGLVLASPAAAHVSITPDTVRTGAPVDLEFSIPNESDPNGISRVTVKAPSGFELDDGEAVSGWTQSRSGQLLVWTGGNIPQRQYAGFGIRGTAPLRAGTALFGVRVSDRTGRALTYQVGVAVVAHAPRDSGARGLAKAALIVAAIAALISLAGLFVGLYLWLRPPSP